MKFEGSLDGASAALRGRAPYFILRADETGSVSDVEERIAIYAFVVAIEEGFHWRACAFLCLSVDLET